LNPRFIRTCSWLICWHQLWLKGLAWLPPSSGQNWWQWWALRSYDLTISQLSNCTTSIPILYILISCSLPMALCTTLSALACVITHTSVHYSGTNRGRTNAPICTNVCLVSLVVGYCSLWHVWNITRSVSTEICAGTCCYMLVFVCASDITMAASDGIDTAMISSILHAFPSNCNGLFLRFIHLVIEHIIVILPVY